MNKVPLNQTYQIKKTFKDYPEVKRTFDDITKFTFDNNFIRTNGSPKGRIYDDAVLFNSDVDFKDKIVCDLGARDGIFGSYLSKYVNKIYVSDYFEEWGKGTTHDLGQFKYWQKLWLNCAYNPDRMIIETQDMTKLNYPDNFFDIVISTSVIEHIYIQKECKGDILAMQEMIRICKPGGIILISTDIGKESKWISGTFYYSEADLFKRLIDQPGVKLRGKYNFNIDDKNNDALTSHKNVYPLTSVVFSLVKL